MTIRELEESMDLYEQRRCNECERCDRLAFYAMVVWCCVFGCCLCIAAAVLW
jgi:hypothetical protein